MYSILKNNSIHKVILASAFLLVSQLALAQEDKTKDKKEDLLLNYEEPDFLLEKDTLTKVEKRKKKRKKKTFNGLKTRRAFTRRGAGSKETIELFYFLKKYKEPNTYVTNYLFEVLKQRIIEVKDYDKKKYPPKEFKILHGSYVKKQDTTILAEGYFYIGTKHHRWEYFRNDILIDKQVFHKGYPAESQISYYDTDKKKVREVIPYMFGEMTGSYVYFFPNGSIKEKGEYENGKKIGKWFEYYEYKHRSKKITQYPKNAFDDAKPIVLNEWDAEGKVLIGKTGGSAKKSKLGKGR